MSQDVTDLSWRLFLSIYFLKFKEVQIRYDLVLLPSNCKCQNNLFNLKLPNCISLVLCNTCYSVTSHCLLQIKTIKWICKVRPRQKPSYPPHLHVITGSLQKDCRVEFSYFISLVYLLVYSLFVRFTDGEDWGWKLFPKEVTKIVLTKWPGSLAAPLTVIT